MVKNLGTRRQQKAFSDSVQVFISLAKAGTLVSPSKGACLKKKKFKKYRSSTSHNIVKLRKHHSSSSSAPFYMKSTVRSKKGNKGKK